MHTILCPSLPVPLSFNTHALTDLMHLVLGVPLQARGHSRARARAVHVRQHPDRQ